MPGGIALNCAICLERLNTPKILPCGHTFCVQCLEELTNRTNSGDNRIRCSICRASHEIPRAGATGFPTNYEVQQILSADISSDEPRVSDESNTNQGRQIIYPVQTNQQQEVADLQLALQISAQEMQSTEQQEQNVDRTIAQEGNTENRRVQGENVRGTRTREENIENRIVQEENDSTCGIIRFIRNIRGAILNDYGVLPKVLLVALTLVSVSRFVAGAAKISSNCDLEQRAAIYLFVKAFVALLFWGAIIVWMFKRNIGEILNNPFIEAYMFLDLTFSLGWLAVGTMFIFGNYSKIYNKCHNIVKNWNGHFINFALVLTIADYIILAVFILFIGYKLCEMRNQNS